MPHSRGTRAPFLAPPGADLGLEAGGAAPRLVASREPPLPVDDLALCPPFTVPRASCMVVGMQRALGAVQGRLGRPGRTQYRGNNKVLPPGMRPPPGSPHVRRAFFKTSLMDSSSALDSPQTRAASAEAVR